MHTKTRGFTLIELLVVIAIIGMLSTVVLASLNGARAKARDARRIADLKQIAAALEVYYLYNNAYPIGGYNGQCASWGGLAADLVIPGLVPTYLASLPADPGMRAADNVNCYLYASLTGQDYKLLAYNLSSDVDIDSQPGMVDPYRNIGTAWQHSSPCPGAGEGGKAWAIYTEGARCAF